MQETLSGLPVGGEHDALVLAELEELGLVEERVALDLVGGDLGLALLHDVAHLGRIEIGDADAPNEAFFHQLLHRLEGVGGVDLYIIPKGWTSKIKMILLDKITY